MDKLTKYLRSFYILVFTLAAPMLLWPSTSMAYLSAPLTPIYMVGHTQRGGCIGGFATISFTGGSCRTLIGYIATAQESGTVPFYLVGQMQRGGCIGGFTGLSTTGGTCTTRIGYINSSQVAGTVPLYKVGKILRGCIGGFVTISFTGGSCRTLLGYIYPKTPEPDNYTVSPKYFIGSVRYVPPGAGVSSITYGAGTLTGTTISTTNSWNVSNSVGGSIGIVDIKFGNAYGGSTTHSVDMQRTTSQSENFKAPPSNYINHDYDIIQLYLGVKVNASVDYLGKVTWGADFSKIASQGFAENGYNIAVGCLRPNSTVPASECASTLSVLNFAGITSADYPSILGANPFADPAAPQPLTPDIDRYVLIDAVAYYYQPTITSFTYNESNNTTFTNSSTSTYSYTVDASSNLPGGFLKASTKFTWTNSSTQSNKTGISNSGSFTLTNPSPDYTGPTTLFVYMDTIYKTFMFSFQ